ncbi:unnamed protein product [Auanema sp. JU1783]|nr:unnamed protein product [Auanema sp. JU1783]
MIALEGRRGFVMRTRQIPYRKRLVDVHCIPARAMGASASTVNRNPTKGFIGNEKQPKILVLASDFLTQHPQLMKSRGITRAKFAI